MTHWLVFTRPADGGIAPTTSKKPSLDEYQKNYLKDLQLKNAKYVSTNPLVVTAVKVIARSAVASSAY